MNVGKKDIVYKYYKYDPSGHGLDISTWKKYLDYNYKKGSDQYKIRFYLNAKNKVTAIFFIKNIDTFYAYPNKEVKCGMVFKTPKGKKVSKKKINGKTVYLVPKGTKISFNSNRSKLALKQMYLDYFLSYNKYGKSVHGLRTGAPLKGQNYILEKSLKTIGVNDYKSSKYLYHVIAFGSNGYAPYIFYYKIV